MKQQDVGVREECVRVVKDTIATLGGLDIIVSNAGWTKFTEFADLYAMSDEDWDKVSRIKHRLVVRSPLANRLIRAVLGSQRQRSFPSVPRGRANFCNEPGGRRLPRYLVSGGAQYTLLNMVGSLVF